MSAPEIITQIVVAGLSAFGGAFAAFLLERRRDRGKQRDERYLAARYAHLMMLIQYQELLVLERDSFLPFKDRDEAWRMLPPLIAGYVATPLNVKELSFVMEGSDPDLLNRLVVGQQQYDTIRKTLKVREEAHSAFQSRVANLYTDGEQPFENEDALARAVGLDIVGRLRSSTQAFFHLLPSARDQLKANLEDLTEFVRDTFPKRREPKFELTNEPAPESPASRSTR